MSKTFNAEICIIHSPRCTEMHHPLWWSLVPGYELVLVFCQMIPILRMSCSWSPVLRTISWYTFSAGQTQHFTDKTHFFALVSSFSRSLFHRTLHWRSSKTTFTLQHDSITNSSLKTSKIPIKPNQFSRTRKVRFPISPESKEKARTLEFPQRQAENPRAATRFTYTWIRELNSLKANWETFASFLIVAHGFARVESACTNTPQPQ